MDIFYQLYEQFLSYFPNFLHPVISIGLAILFVYSVFQALKQNIIFIIILVVLLPASLPILKSILDIIVSIVQFLLP
jgi:hypothetical protein